MKSAADVAQVVTAVVAIVGIGLSAWLAMRAVKYERETLRQHWNIEGSMYAAQWREHIIKLSDRGLSVDEIRKLVALEKDQEQKGRTELGSEIGSGKIEAIVALAPPKRSDPVATV
jgi:hypothetical protein